MRLLRQRTVIKSAKIKNIILAQQPKTKLKIKHLRAAFVAPISLLQASSSETTLVAAILIPAEARVIPNIYTDMTREKTPTASSPIVLDIYMLKNIPITCSKTEENSKINVFNTNIFNVLKISSFQSSC